MQQGNHQPKQTSGRRRHPRNAQGAAHKNYASENDVSSDTPFQPDFSTGSPQTPQKSNSGSPAPNSVPANSKSNKRTANKSRPKNVSTSPRPVKPGRHTPPHTAAAKQPASTAFAGATFHASPAPSSLPIPSFLSKSGTDSPGFKDPGRVSQEPSPPTSDSDTPTLQPATVSQAAREESPLDILFRADRAEKERARRTSSANIMESVVGPFSPPTEPRSPENAAYSRGPGSQPRLRPNFQRSPSSGISSTELDGTPGRPMGPAFSTPYQDRIKAARSADRREQQSPRILREQQFQQHPTPPSSDDKSEALKKFLFGSQQAGQQGGAPASGPQNRAFNPPPAYFAGAPVAYPQHNIPSPPAVRNPEPDRNTEFAAIEDSLRRVLKLDMNMSSTPTLANAHRS